MADGEQRDTHWTDDDVLTPSFYLARRPNENGFSAKSLATNAWGKRVIWFLGDVHGRFDHVIRLVKLHRPEAVVFLGDLECSLPLDMILRPILCTRMGGSWELRDRPEYPLSPLRVRSSHPGRLLTAPAVFSSLECLRAVASAPGALGSPRNFGCRYHGCLVAKPATQMCHPVPLHDGQQSPLPCHAGCDQRGRSHGGYASRPDDRCHGCRE